MRYEETDGVTNPLEIAYNTPNLFVEYQHVLAVCFYMLIRLVIVTKEITTPVNNIPMSVLTSVV